MKYLAIIFGMLAVMTVLSSCSTTPRKQAEPIVQKPRKVTALYFSFNQSVLQSEELEKISPTIQHLKNHPSWIVQLEGNADAIGASAYNLRLGDMRARTVKEAMVMQGVPPEQLIILSFGEDNPVAGNNNEAGRQLNRRVDVKVR